MLTSELLTMTDWPMSTCPVRAMAFTMSSCITPLLSAKGLDKQYPYATAMLFQCNKTYKPTVARKLT